MSAQLTEEQLVRANKEREELLARARKMELVFGARPTEIVAALLSDAIKVGFELGHESGHACDGQQAESKPDSDVSVNSSQAETHTGMYL